MTKTGAPTHSLGELSRLLASWRLHLAAANLSARAIRACTDDSALFAAFQASNGMPAAAHSIHREHAEAFNAAELQRIEDQLIRGRERLRRGLNQPGASRTTPTASQPSSLSTSVPTPCQRRVHIPRRRLPRADGRRQGHQRSPGQPHRQRDLNRRSFRSPWGVPILAESGSHPAPAGGRARRWPGSCRPGPSHRDQPRPGSGCPCSPFGSGSV